MVQPIQLSAPGNLLTLHVDHTRQEVVATHIISTCETYHRALIGHFLILALTHHPDYLPIVPLVDGLGNHRLYTWLGKLGFRIYPSVLTRTLVADHWYQGENITMEWKGTPTVGLSQVDAFLHEGQYPNRLAIPDFDETMERFPLAMIHASVNERRLLRAFAPTFPSPRASIHEWFLAVKEYSLANQQLQQTYRAKGWMQTMLVFAACVAISDEYAMSWCLAWSMAQTWKGFAPWKTLQTIVPSDYLSILHHCVY